MEEGRVEADQAIAMSLKPNELAQALRVVVGLDQITIASPQHTDPPNSKR